MIIQIWQAIAPLANVDEYQTLLSEKAIPFYKTTDGNMGVFLCREINDQLANFLFLTMWSSREALDKFRGPNIEAISNTPEVKKLLLAFESKARIYEIFQMSESRKRK